MYDKYKKESAKLGETKKLTGECNMPEISVASLQHFPWVVHSRIFIKFQKVKLITSKFLRQKAATKRRRRK